ncbi:MAG: 2-phospho-L-lactate transferase [Sphingomonadaceae bacterium]|nr:2-phospho-L-lactate transferase [Sphingomonadaceae bacterium]
MNSVSGGKVVVLTGGVGGAKLVLGLAQILPPEQIVAIVNTGDDFRHLGLWISPDLDTLLYTLSGKANATQGWGREGETWQFMSALRSLGGEGWFQLGDGDLALHVLRTAALAQGETLSTITQRFGADWNVGVRMLPMSDDPVATHLTTDEGDLPFQRYFVERRCVPRVSSIRFEGAERARAAPGVAQALRDTGTRAILIAPSNPYLSVDPILAIPEIRQALREASAPIVAISPIVGGKAVKGPTAKLMEELGIEVSPAAVAAHYGELLDGMIFDRRDPVGESTLPRLSIDTLMVTLEDRVRVASAALQLADRLAE